MATVNCNGCDNGVATVMAVTAMGVAGPEAVVITCWNCHGTGEFECLAKIAMEQEPFDGLVDADISSVLSHPGHLHTPISLGPTVN